MDLVYIIKNRRTENKVVLNGYTQEDFESIYLFFDYDAHDPAAKDDKLIEMLNFFNDEHDRGLLYVSYPMVEAFRHFHDIQSFKELIVKCKRDNCPI